MKLDPDLIRKILMAYEELPYGGGSEEIEIEGYSRDQLAYHQEILEEAGYIKVEIGKYLGGNYSVLPERLTYLGHEFLNASRDNEAWDKTKTALLKSGGFVLEVAKALLISYLQAQLFPN